MNNIIKLSDYKNNGVPIMVRACDLKKIFIGTSNATFTKWGNLGLITRYKISGGVYYKLSEIEKLIETSAENKTYGNNNQKRMDK